MPSKYYRAPDWLLLHAAGCAVFRLQQATGLTPPGRLGEMTQ